MEISLTPDAVTLPARPDRRRFIGGSDIASIMGIQPPGWRTALDLWELKILPDAAVEPETPEEVRKRLARGTIVEPLVATMLAMLHGLPGIDVRNRRYVDPLLPYFAAEIDAEIPLGAVRDRFDSRADPYPDETMVNVEIKTVHPFAIREWGEEGGDSIPIHYAAQIQWGLGVRDFRPLALCAALFGADDLRLYPLYIDTPVVLEMRRRAQIFWQCVEEREAPAAQTSADVLRLWPKAVARIAEATPEIAAFAGSLRGIKRIAKAEDGVSFAIKEFMRDADTLAYDGQVIATFKNKATSRIDLDRLESEFPEAAKACRVQGTTRELRLAKEE
jgi:putative phage-type endonuclease